jgi:hypothetical protein
VPFLGPSRKRRRQNYTSAARITHKPGKAKKEKSEYDSKSGHNLTLKLTEIEIHKMISIPNPVCWQFCCLLFVYSCVKTDFCLYQYKVGYEDGE